ncbi:hypothetical protein AB0F13_24020 [Streptomyces sp. NPDC026206]|uniref:hypothetical protein n=1 Tax=Streptomyces sp. NPDC026206 TaxID=3157089 RepID=UPI0033F2A35E
MRGFLTAVASAAAGMALVVSAQGVAAAATGTASGGSVPGCVTAKQWAAGTIWVDVTNNCSTVQRVQVRYVNRIDETCYVLQPGEKRTSSLPFNFARFDRLVGC